MELCLAVSKKPALDPAGDGDYPGMVVVVVGAFSLKCGTESTRGAGAGASEGVSVPSQFNVYHSVDSVTAGQTRDLNP